MRPTTIVVELPNTSPRLLYVATAVTDDSDLAPVKSTESRWDSDNGADVIETLVRDAAARAQCTAK